MLTDDFINSLPLPEKRREIADEETRGLYLIVLPTGAKFWIVRYRIAGTAKKMTLGRYPKLNLATARKRTRDALDLAAAGAEPATAKRADKVAASEGIARTGRGKRLAEREIGTRDRHEADGTLVKEIAAHWEGRPLSQVKRAEVHEILDTLLDHGAPIRASRVFARLIGDWAIVHGAVRRDLTPSTRRNRVLSDEEIRLAWKAFDRIGPPLGPIGKLLLLTGARRDEIVSGRWSDVDFASMSWTIPAERSKKGVAREIPLSDAAIRILQGLPRTHGEDGPFFVKEGTSFSGARTTISKAISAILKEEAETRGHDSASINAPTTWTFYNLRRTVAWNLQRLGIRREVAESVLDYGIRSPAWISGIYPTQGFAAEKRIALAVWANRLDAIATGPAASPEVVERDQEKLH